jgi:hypothetical protein
MQNGPLLHLYVFILSMAIFFSICLPTLLGMLTLAPSWVKFITFHVDAFKLSQLQGSFYRKWVNFNIESLWEKLISTLAPEFESWYWISLLAPHIMGLCEITNGPLVSVTLNFMLHDSPTFSPSPVSYEQGNIFLQKSFVTHLLQLFFGLHILKKKKKKRSPCVPVKSFYLRGCLCF